jgi:four helix bundle protein
MVERAEGVRGPERLRVYHLAQDLAMSVNRIARVSARNGSIADQLRRSAESIALGAGHSPGRKIYHYQLARGSAGECIAALTQLNRRKPSEMIALSRTSANMVSPMLTAPIDSHNPTVATPAFPAPCRPPHVARPSSPAVRRPPFVARPSSPASHPARS